MACRLLGLLMLVVISKLSGAYEPNPDIGVSAGLVSNCPGVTKNATLKPRSQLMMQVVVHSLTDSGQMVRKSLPITTAAKTIARYKYLDFRKKTFIYVGGYLDSSVFPHSLALANSYAKRGYNVLLTETIFFTYFYPKSVRVSRAIGKLLGEFITKLADQGLDADKLEMVGASLGAHTAAYAANHLYVATGRKPYRITGLDPAGPCFRAMPPEEKLQPSDAQRVDVLHTNIDGFGIAERLGHVDFYVNGGEYQPGDIPSLPCLVICSHIRAIIYFWIALEHPKKFVGMQCDSIQDARFAKCYDSPVTNYMGLETNFNRTGIFYLPTHNEFPYYRGKDGLNKNKEIYTETIRRENIDDILEV